MKEVISMIKTITVRQAKRLCDEEDAKELKFIDKVDIDDKGKYQVIFKKIGNSQLYSFNYIFNYLFQLPNFGVSDIVKTLERPYYSLDSIENHNEYHVKVYPVKKLIKQVPKVFYKNMEDKNMKTKEFIDKIKDSYSYTEGDNDIAIHNILGGTLAVVSKVHFGVVDTFYPSFEADSGSSDDIKKLLLDYALTPLDKREDELKFNVRMIPEQNNDNRDVYLNLDKEYSDIFIDNTDEVSNVQTIFTESEYDKLQQKYSKWLPKFNKDDPHFEIIGER